MITLTHEDWLAEATKRCDGNFRKLRFRCPSCGYVQTAEDFLTAGWSVAQIDTQLGFSCIGRRLPAAECQEAFMGGPGPCNYAGGGLIRIAPIRVMIGDEERYTFDFADDPIASGLEIA